jgi:hypothetical protein
MKISIVKPPENTSGFESVEVKNFSQLAGYCLGYNISTGIFKGGYRNKENFEAAYCIGLDFDNDPKELDGIAPLMLEEAKVAFAEFKHIILASRSHQKEKHGLVTDRFRVFLILNGPITDKDIWEATWQWCKDKWPATDNKCKDPSRLWYQHSAVVQIVKEGKTVDPVVPKPKEPTKGNVDLATLPPGSKGKLSRETLEFLLSGREQGGRNAATYKAAKEFQQNLYTFDEATEQIISALERTGTLARDFTEAEAVQTIRSAFNTEAKHDPRVTPKAFNMLPIGEVFKTNLKVEWLCEHLLPMGGLGLLSARPKIGKSVLSRQLMRSVLRGETFLGRKCRQGSVIYLALEEQIETINEEFRRLGVQPNEPLFVHAGAPLTDTVKKDFSDLIMDTKPALAVVDTLFDLVEAEENNYKEVKREMRDLRKLARESGTHILCVHHNNKGTDNPKYKTRGPKNILGSTAITGGVDTIMVMDDEGNKRILTAIGRGVKRFSNALLRFDFRDCTYSIGPEEDEF